MEEQNNAALTQAPTPATPISNNTSEVDHGKVCAILAYLLIGIVWYFVDDNMKKNEFAKFHVKQGLVLLVVSLILQIIGTILPIIGWFIILPLSALFSLVWVLIGIINAFNGKTQELPLIGKYSVKFNF